MEFKQALYAVKNGSRVRRKWWNVNKWIRQDPGSAKIVDQSGQEYLLSSCELFVAADWVVCDDNATTADLESRSAAKPQITAHFPDTDIRMICVRDQLDRSNSFSHRAYSPLWSVQTDRPK